MQMDCTSAPIVSIICPSYNHAPYLRQALDSILMQKVSFRIEVLVGEDCSPDNSREILRDYEKKYCDIFRMFYREKNMGATKNGHDLRMRAKGKYLITLETDDYWTDPLKLQKQVDFLEAHPEYIGCGHVYERVDENGTKIKFECTEYADKCFTLQDFLAGKGPVQTATLLLRNIFLDEEDFSIITTAHSTVGDFTIMSILLERGNIFILPECMSAYRQIIHKKSLSFSAWEKEHLAESILAGVKMILSLDEYFKGRIDYGPRLQPAVNRYVSEWIRRRTGFTTEGMHYLWSHVSWKVRIHSILFVIGFPLRKLIMSIKKG